MRLTIKYCDTSRAKDMQIMCFLNALNHRRFLESKNDINPVIDALKRPPSKAFTELIGIPIFSRAKLYAQINGIGNTIIMTKNNQCHFFPLDLVT